MPQEHYVLKCFSCETFQAHIVKKSKKWECKICGVKQSLKRNYGKGSGKDCRVQVMRLNELRLTKSNDLNSMEDEIFNKTFTEVLNDEQTKEQLQVQKPLTSKWAEYMEENTTDKESESDECATDFFLESNKKSKKRLETKTRKCSFKKRKTCIEFKKNKPTQECEETVKKSDLLSFLNNQTFDSYEKKEQENKKDWTNQYKNELKPSKYAKYLEEQENENILKVVKKTTNIFDSDITDLDSLLNF